MQAPEDGDIDILDFLYHVPWWLCAEVMITMAASDTIVIITEGMTEAATDAVGVTAVAIETEVTTGITITIMDTIAIKKMPLIERHFL